MRKLISILVATFFTIVVTASALSVHKSQSSQEHTEWVAKSLIEMQSVKAGMTRSDLLKVFQEEGGLSTRAQRTYVYRQCPYIKVDVKFEAVEEPHETLKEYSSDKIIKISKPFLDWSVLD